MPCSYWCSISSGSSRTRRARGRTPEPMQKNLRGPTLTQTQQNNNIHTYKTHVVGCAIQTMKFPEVSTVTYMTGQGAPTVIFNQTTPDGVEPELTAPMPLSLSLPPYHTLSPSCPKPLDFTVPLSFFPLSQLFSRYLSLPCLESVYRYIIYRVANRGRIYMYSFSFFFPFSS